MLKYFYYNVDNDNEEEISSAEYTETLLDDAEFSGESVSAAMRVVRENRKDARETGSSVWALMNGNQLIIKSEKKKV